MTKMALQFIEQGPGDGAIGASERRIIRSHVMKGKNVGRPRPSRRKLATIVHVKDVLTPPNTPASDRSSPRSLMWNDLSLVTFPQQLDSEATKLMHRWFFDISDSLFPPQFCRKFDIIKSIWVNCILADEAYFHSTLAISASYINFFKRKPGISSKTLYHISKAYAQVNIRLSSPQSVCDSTIAAVITLAIYQQIHHQYSTGLVHLNGLYRMIQLRGGITTLLRENRALALKSLRLDVELALQTGSLPLFSSSDFPSTSLSILSSSTPQNCFPTTHKFKLSPLAHSILSISHLLNTLPSGSDRESKLDPLIYTEMLLSLLYRLVETVPPTRNLLTKRSVEDIVHLGCLAFMTTLLPDYSCSNECAYPLLSMRLESGMRDLSAMVEDGDEEGGYEELLLWMGFVSGISVLKSKEKRRCLGGLILEVCRRLGLNGWGDVRGRLGEWPWIVVLHDGSGKVLWEEIQGGNVEMA